MVFTTGILGILTNSGDLYIRDDETSESTPYIEHKVPLENVIDFDVGVAFQPRSVTIGCGFDAIFSVFPKNYSPKQSVQQLIFLSLDGRGLRGGCLKPFSINIVTLSLALSHQGRGNLLTPPSADFPEELCFLSLIFNGIPAVIR